MRFTKGISSLRLACEIEMRLKAQKVGPTVLVHDRAAISTRTLGWRAAPKWCLRKPTLAEITQTNPRLSLREDSQSNEGALERARQPQTGDCDDLAKRNQELH